MRCRRRRDILAWSLAGALAGAVAGGVCVNAGGASLGTFLGPLLIVAAVVPQSAGRARRLAPAAAFVLAMSLAVAAAWTLTGASAGAIVHASFVLLAWSALLAASTAVLIPRPNRRRGITRAAIITISAWLWLAWPVWLGPALAARGGDIPTWLTAVHPLFAMNSAVRELGIWTQEPLPYRLTPLGQDLAYALPAHIGWFVITHVATSALLLALVYGKRWVRR